MKKSKSKVVEDELYEPMTTKGKVIAALVIASPLIVYAGISLLGAYYKAHPDPKPHYSFTYDYVPHQPDIVNKPPKFKSGRDEAIPANQNEGGVVLHLNGVTIATGADADEILQQLTIDYQDLFDQYGGADELY